VIRKAMATRTAPDRELLLARHEFPGEYVIKAFGPGDDEFRAQVQAAAAPVRFSSSERATRSGRRICVTLTLQVETVDEVIEVYGRLHLVRTLQLIL
jgi:putative lipoic acid-binding regulatory protein